MPLSEFEIENSMSCQHYIKIHGKYVQVKTILIEKTLYVIERGRTTYSALLHSSMSTTDNTTYTVSQRTPDMEVRPKVKTIIFCHALFTT